MHRVTGMASWLSPVRRHSLLQTTRQRSFAHGHHHYSPPVTKIEKLVLDSIKATGPLSFATYTQFCLSHPTHGYYMNPSNPVFGTRGDFITSPEISQIFGELVGIWLLSQWSREQQGSQIRFIELGPGRGTLMADVLRVVSKFTPKNETKDVHLVETSPAMRKLQNSNLQPQADQMGFKLHWHDSIDEVPRSNAYSMLIAHEFFDALPFHVLQKGQNGWREVMVGSSLDAIRDPRSRSETTLPQEAEEPRYPRLQRVLSSVPSALSTVLGLSSPRFRDLPPDSTIEVSPTSFKIGRRIGELLSTSSDKDGSTNSGGGCGLIIDYGGAKVFGDSFRAFKDHKIVDVFHLPGECDLTTNVDFAFLQEAMDDLVDTHGPISQSTFLESMGLRLRLSQLLMNAETEERRSAIEGAANRLVDRLGMGKQYQVMGITPKGSKGSGGEWPFI